jgi:hypothetical protein
MSDPIKRIVNSKGEVKYRFIVDVGRKPDGRRDQRCSTFPTLREARAALSQIKADRSRGTLVRPQRSPSRSCASGGWLPVTTSGRSPSRATCTH